MTPTEIEKTAKANEILRTVKMSYKVKDADGNILTYGGLDSAGFIYYIGEKGRVYLYSMKGLTTVQQYAE